MGNGLETSSSTEHVLPRATTSMLDTTTSFVSFCTWRNVLALLGVMIGGCVLSEIVLAVYRLTIHPLAKFPGSKLAAATKWYECFHDVFKGEGGQYAWKMQEMHRKYGPIIRINPDEIHIADPNYFDTIYAPIPARRDKYGPAANMVGCPLGTFGTQEHFTHRKRRAANSILFSAKHVADSTELIHERLDLLCNALSRASQTDEVLHLQTELLAFTTDLLTIWVLDKPMGCQSNHATAERWERTTRSLPRVTPIIKQFPWIIKLALKLPHRLIHALQPNIAYVATIHKDMHEEARSHANRRDEVVAPSKREFLKHGGRLTVFQAIDISELPEHEKRVNRQAEEAFVLVAAGTETTARTMTSCMFQLVDNPTVLVRLRAELEAAMPSVTDLPSVKVLEKMPYFTAVLKENLRTMQLMTSRFPLIADKDLVYQEWTIPSGTPVSMTINEILTDPEIYPNPDEFLPERWLNEQGELHEDLQPWFMPFGRGTRMCAGQNVAWTVMYLTIAKLVRRFDFKMYDTIRSRDFVITRDCFFGTITEESAGIRMQVEKDLLLD